MRHKGFFFKLRVKQPEFDKAFLNHNKKGATTEKEPTLPKPKKTEKTSNKIFIVHGHNEEVKEKVARFIEKLGLEPIILHEQPNGGRTLIEKFEEHTDVAFAVVLMTDDDQGSPKGKSPEELKLRARQNVILEQGYFFGRLGRDKVCVLHMEGVEIPSDLLGIVYIPLREGDAWKFELAKEIKESGVTIDMNLTL